MKSDKKAPKNSERGQNPSEHVELVVGRTAVEITEAAIILSVQPESHPHQPSIRDCK